MQRFLAFAEGSCCRAMVAWRIVLCRLRMCVRISTSDDFSSRCHYAFFTIDIGRKTVSAATLPPCLFNHFHPLFVVHSSYLVRGLAKVGNVSHATLITCGWPDCTTPTTHHLHYLHHLHHLHHQHHHYHFYFTPPPPPDRIAPTNTSTSLSLPLLLLLLDAIVGDSCFSFSQNGHYAASVYPRPHQAVAFACEYVRQPHLWDVFPTLLIFVSIVACGGRLSGRYSGWQGRELDGKNLGGVGLSTAFVSLEACGHICMEIRRLDPVSSTGY